MNVDRIVHLVAGSMVLLSILLANMHHPGWMWLGVFVGANLAQSGISNFCPLATILRKLGVSDRSSCCN